MKVFVRKDIFVIVIILLVAVSFFLFENSKAKAGRVVVYVDGKRVMIIDRPGEYPVYRNGKRVTTVVFNGKEVRVKDSTCPLKICEKMGWVGPGGEIICVPNRVVVKFEGSKIDTLTW